MKKIYLLLGLTLSLCCLVNFSYAQEAASATWPLTLAAEADPTTKVGTPTVSGNVTAQNQHLNNMNINQYTGPGGSQRSQIWFDANEPKNAWPASNSAMIANVYNQFEVGPASGNTLNVQSISFKIGAHSTGNMRARAFYSTDPTFAAANTTEFTGLGSSVVLSTSELRTITATPNLVLNEGQRLYIRIHGWFHNQTSGLTGKYITLQDMTISGETTPAGSTATAPIVATNNVTDITLTSATVSGNVTADGGAAVTARGIAYGTSENPTTADNTMAAGEGTGEFSVELNGLTPNTIYFARAYATNSEGTSYGDHVSFNTLAPLALPTVTTTAVTDETATSAQSGGNITENGGAAITARGVVWSTSENPTTADSKTEDGAGEGNFTSELTGLTAETMYYVRAYATNSEGTAYGEQVSFATLPDGEAPVRVLYVTEIKTMDASLTAEGRNPILEDPIITMLKADPNFVVTTKALTMAEANTATFPIDLANHDLLVIQESMGGDRNILKPGGTLALTNLTIPTIYNKNFALNNGRAVVNTANSLDASSIVSTVHYPVLSLIVSEANRTHPIFRGISFDEDGSFEVFKTGATDGGAVATGANVPKGFSYNNAVVISPENRPLATFPATAGKEIAATGTPIFFNDVPSGSIVGQQTLHTRVVFFGMNFGAMSKDLGTNMTPAGYAMWRNAIYDLAGLPITVPVTAPVVTTLTPATEITLTAATVGGNVVADGGAAVTARGIAYGTSENPTTADNTAAAGEGTGSFSSELTGLTPGTTYFARAYATNSEGTAYGQEVSFTTEAEEVPVMDPASATWPLTSTTAGAAVTSGQVDAAPQQLNNMTINQYSGPNNSQRIQIAGGSWPANQTDMIPNTFIQFAVSPKPNNNLHVDNISFDMSTAGGISTLKAKVFYSTDADFTTSTELAYSTGNSNNYLGNGVITTVDASVDVAVNNGQTFYLRIYPWIEDPTVRTGKYVTLQNVVIAGETESTPVMSSVVWANDQSFSTTGAITGAAPAYSAAMKYYGVANPLPTTDTNEEVRGMAIQTVSQDWQAEPNPVESLWFQYEVSPKTGATLNVTNVSMYIGGWFSSNLRAAIYYSKDPTFAERTLLVADRALPGNQMAPISVDLNETVNTDETFYVRIYPHNTQAEGWAKLVSVHNMTISGTALGATVDPATVVTVSPATEISTTFATLGGNITSDGGSPVSARGIAWGTSENPTITDNTTSAGTGSGAFSAQLTGLTPGTTYYARAFGTNEAGTSYGNQVSFATLAELAVPTVTTTAASNILTKTAQSGGNVTAWGGAEVTARGIVWNTTGNPTLTDNKTESGTGIGSFSSQLHSLTAQTTYHVRAYATNSQGTGYGPEITFTTQQQAPDVTKIVAKDGSGDYTTVQAAFNAVPDFYTGKYTILVKPGTYKEKLILERNKVNVILRGENPFNTILTYDDYAGKNGLGTSGSYSVAIEPDDFIAANITFENTVQNDGSQANQQAVALRVNGDRQAYYNCRILGYQDTFYAWGGRVVGRIYMKDCFIEGSVDFIFGRDIVVFDNCTINVNRQGGMVTAASTESNTKHGFVFLNSTVTADAVGFNGTPITSFHLGRPWQAAPRTVYMNTFLPASLNPEGWSTWNTTPALYGEYNNSGPGASTTGRSAISRLLTPAEAAEHTVANIFAKETHPAFSFDWMPENVNYPVTSVMPETRNASFSLGQNYPNPFNAATTIEFELKKAGQVTLEVFDITGRKVATLADGFKPAGTHEVKLNNTFQDGIYLYRLSADGVTATRRMVITR